MRISKLMNSAIVVLLVGAIALSACSATETSSILPDSENAHELSTGEVSEGPDFTLDENNTEFINGDDPQGDSDLEIETSTSVDESAVATPRPPLAEGEWMSLPVIPEVSARALEIYAGGISKGNDPNRFSKVGDCQNVPSMFVSIFDHPGFYTLGEEHEYLSETIEWYQGSFKHESEAVRRGFNAASVVSPVWADPETCEIGEDPLKCELRIQNPSIAIVSLETWWAGAPDNYEKYVRQILETLIDNGVLPILATKADNLEGDHFINSILAGLAHEYQIPLWNYWLAVQPLPNHGLMEDDFHLTFAANEFDDPLIMEAAWPWRNLTALQMLHAVRTAVDTSN